MGQSQEVCGQGVCVCVTMGVYTSPPSYYGQQVGGAHPTGMGSCYVKQFSPPSV